VLVTGESGTGKTLIARALHHNSTRRDEPFVEVNCGALPETLLESELFGHKRGAFTGAHADKPGKFAAAHRGTIFLDEINNASPMLQMKLLRILQDKEFEPVGGNDTIRVDVRVVLATNLDLAKEVETGNFRRDLYYRINVVSIHMPPLRERVSDIPLLAKHFLKAFAKENDKSIREIDEETNDLLARYGWPGNVRELENVIERAVVVCDELIIREQHLPATLFDAEKQPEQLSLSDAVEQLERQMIDNALRTECGNVAAAARTLGTTERILRYKAQKLGVDPLRFKR
jgi:Nif-specific regulatory protein